MKHRAKLLMSIRVVAPGENSGKEVANQHHRAQSERSETIGNQPCGRQRTMDVAHDPTSNGPNWPPCRSLRSIVALSVVRHDLSRSREVHQAWQHAGAHTSLGPCALSFP